MGFAKLKPTTSLHPAYEPGGLLAERKISLHLLTSIWSPMDQHEVKPKVLIEPSKELKGQRKKTLHALSGTGRHTRV